ncbi:MAG: hypothetical protein ACXWMH_06575, partial [Syntrophales bacterium]
ARTSHAMQISLLALLVRKNAATLADAYNADRTRNNWATPLAEPDYPVRPAVSPSCSASNPRCKRRLG